MKNFLDIKDIKKKDLINIFLLAEEIKNYRKNPEKYKETPSFVNALKNKNIIVIFEKSSTRTRVSFEFGIKELGGNCCILNSQTSHLSKSESIEDTARVLDQMVDCVIIRTFGHNRMLKLAENCKNACVINALTDQSHPCQIMADLLTFLENKHPEFLNYNEEKMYEILKNINIAWYGDVNNMLNSWIEASEKFGFKINICCPEQLKNKIPNNKNCTFFKDKIECAKNCDIITTDTWVSMGDGDKDLQMFKQANLNVDIETMKNAKQDAIFLHCLPAYRGYEVDAEVIDNEKYSNIVFQEAGNRLHIQKAILLYCFDKLYC